MNPQRSLQIDQSDNFDTVFLNFAYKMATLLLGHIGIFI